MNSMLRLIAIGVVAFGITVCFPRAHAADGDKFTKQQLEDVVNLNGKRLDRGEEAVSVLESPTATMESKANAARAIGEIQYTSGIPALIKHIDFENPSNVTEMRTGHPCVDALGEIGVAAVPALVKAYALETSKDRKEFIVQAIFLTDPPEAKTYALGLLARATDERQKRALNELLAEFTTSKRR